MTNLHELESSIRKLKSHIDKEISDLVDHVNQSQSVEGDNFDEFSEDDLPVDVDLGEPAGQLPEDYMFFSSNVYSTENTTAAGQDGYTFDADSVAEKNNKIYIP